MKALLDTCVIYPTVMREMLLAVAATGAFTPLWSARIIEEWQRATTKLGPDGVAQAGAEAVLLAAAVAGSADVIVTLNAKDFPRGVLAEEGVSRADPDAFLLGLHAAEPDDVAAAADRVLARATEISGTTWEMRKLLKKARLPRLGRALTR